MTDAASKQNGANKLKRKDYEKELRKLQAELCHLQAWVKDKGLRVIIVFEGRDTAGKGGTIKAITERVSPRVFRVVALPAPTEREKSQMFIQRYIQEFPAAGEIVIFDRSWYNRAGVEYVMGYCSKTEHERFLELCPQIEKFIVDGNTVLIKIWLEVGQDEQEKRFAARITDPLRQWKLSPMDIRSYDRWYDYSRARDLMLKATDSKHAPWYIVRSGRQAAGAAQLHFAHPVIDPVQEIAQGEDQDSQALEQTKVRRSVDLEGAKFRSGDLLTFAERCYRGLRTRKNHMPTHPISETGLLNHEQRTTVQIGYAEGQATLPQ